MLLPFKFLGICKSPKFYCDFYCHKYPILNCCPVSHRLCCYFSVNLNLVLSEIHKLKISGLSSLRSREACLWESSSQHCILLKLSEQIHPRFRSAEVSSTAPERTWLSGIKQKVLFSPYCMWYSRKLFSLSNTFKSCLVNIFAISFCHKCRLYFFFFLC